MKFLPLSDQDKQLLLNLHQFIYLSKEFIDKYIYIGNNEKNNYRRLSTLEKAGYITSFALPIHEGHKRPSNVYTLQKFGVDIVEQLTGITHWNQKWSLQPQVWYMHTLNLAEVVKSFETHAKNVVVKEWISEAKAHFKYDDSHVIRPDGIMVLGKTDADSNLGIMMEMERSYANRKGIIRKIEQYNHFFDKTNEEKYAERMKAYDYEVGFEYPVKHWMILFVDDNGSMGKRILRYLKDHQSIVTLKVASKDDLIENPFGEVYRDLVNPQDMTGL